MKLPRMVVAAVALTGAAAGSYATDQPSEPVVTSESPAGEAAHQTQAGRTGSDWRLDPAIFTDISPVNAPDIAIKLPEDQREEQ